MNAGTQYIYALVDPRDDAIRYVGKSYRPERRLREHIKEARDGNKTHRCNWLRELGREGVKPEMVLIEACTIDTWADREGFWIGEIGKFANLTNMCAGGEGTSFHSEETKQRCREVNTGKVMSAETRQMLRQANLGRKHSPEQTAKQAASKRGGKHSEAGRERSALAQQKRHHGEVRPVRHVGSGVIFLSAWHAGKALGVRPGAITASLRRGGRCFGMRFEYSTPL